MGNIKKTVYSFISSNSEIVELQAEKVELSNIDDLKEVSRFSGLVEDDALKFDDRIEALMKEVSIFKKSREKDIARAKKDLSSFESAAKKLGLNPNDVKEYSNAKSDLKKAESSLESLTF